MRVLVLLWLGLLFNSCHTQSSSNTNSSIEELVHESKVDTVFTLADFLTKNTNLDEKVEGCVLRKILLFSNKVKQIALTCILQGEVNGFLIFETCVQPANVLVI